MTVTRVCSPGRAAPSGAGGRGSHLLPESLSLLFALLRGRKSFLLAHSAPFRNLKAKFHSLLCLGCGGRGGGGVRAGKKFPLSAIEQDANRYL